MATPKVELAAAYISLVPSLKGSKREIQNELSGAVSPETGKSWGAAIGKGLKRATVVGGAAAAVGAAAAFKKGFDRLVSLDQSKARLKGLGLDPKQIERVAAAAGKAVDGTAFSLADSVGGAVAALGASVKKSDLTPWLKTVGDLTAQSKTDFSSMTSIIAKISGDGKLTGETLAQLSENGVHLVDDLAKSFGVGQQEFRKMASAGEVSADRFMKVANEKFGGSALAMGKTFTGSWDNMWASAGRVTANLMSGVFPLLIKAMGGLRTRIAAIEKPAAAFGLRLGEIATKYGPPVISAMSMFAKVIGTTLSLAWKFRDVIAVLVIGIVSYRVATTAAAVAEQVLLAWRKRHLIVLALYGKAQMFLNAAMSANPIGLLVAALVALGVGLVIAYKKSETFRKIVDGAWRGIQTAVKFAWEKVIQPVLKAYWFYLSKVLFPIIKALWDNVVKPVFTKVGDIVVSVWQKKVKPAFDRFKAGLTALRDGFRLVKDYITKNWDKIAGAITAPIEKAKKILNSFFSGIDKVAEFFRGKGNGFKFRFQVGNPGGASDSTMNRPRGGIGGRHLSAVTGAIGGKGTGGTGGKTWPANTKSLSDNYTGHSGIDIAAAAGSPIKAASSGVIDYTGWGRGYGNAIFQSLPGGLSAVYGHANKTLVRAGQMVRAGQKIGEVGWTGNVRPAGPAGAHLHFEVNGAGPFGSVGNRASTLSWLGGASFSKGGGLSIPKIPGLSLPGWIGGIGGLIRGWAGSWLKGQLFDTGGILNHGGVAVNLSGKPERILTPRQTESFDRLANSPTTGFSRTEGVSMIREAVNGATFHMAADGSLRIKTLAG